MLSRPLSRQSSVWLYERVHKRADSSGPHVASGTGIEHRQDVSAVRASGCLRACPTTLPAPGSDGFCACSILCDGGVRSQWVAGSALCQLVLVDLRADLHSVTEEGRLVSARGRRAASAVHCIDAMTCSARSLHPETARQGRHEAVQALVMTAWMGTEVTKCRLAYT